MTLQPRTRRPGFTLVELMVSAAVSVIIMAVLATVFQSGIDTMRDMRSVGNLQDQLRAATEMIRRDLQADHFVARDTRVNGHLISGPKLSDQWLTDAAWQPTVGGFFRIESAKPTWSLTADADSLMFDGQAGNNGLIHFTSILTGDKPQNMYTTSDSSGTVISSPAAEIQYFVDTSIPTNNRLVRRQRLVAKTDLDRSTYQGKDNAGEVIACTSSNVFTLATVSANRMPSKAMLGGSRAGDDILLSNIKLFEVKAHWDGNPAPRTFTTGTATDAPFDYLNGNGGSSVFDTGNSAPNSGFTNVTPGGSNATQRLRVNAIQIRIRIYDPQVQTSRQVTIVQDL